VSRFVLVPGAGGSAWYWHLLVPILETRGHEAVPVELPGNDDTAGLPEYADAIVQAIDGDPTAVVVAQSLGGFSAPIACTTQPVRLLVLVNAMIPLPGETPGDWWRNTGATEARQAAAVDGGYSAVFDPVTYILHDIPADALASGPDRPPNEADIVFSQPCTISSWPAVDTTVIVGREDRFFPVEFQLRVAHDRLNCDIEVAPGGHLLALSHPEQLADRLCRQWQR